MRRLLAAVLCAVLALGLPAGAQAGSVTVKPVPESPVQVALSSTPLPGRTLSARRALAIASALAKVREARHGHKGSYGAVYTKGPLRWQVSFFSRGGRKELAQVIIADRTGRVLEAWSGFQVAWTMARGYKGAFGEHVNALYIWLPLCLLFMLPVRQLPPAAVAAAPRPAGAAVVLGLAGVLQPRQHLGLGPARLPSAALSAGADAVDAAPPSRRAPGPRDPCAC